MKTGKLVALMTAVLMLVMAAPAYAAGLEASGNSSTVIEASAIVPDIIVVSVPGNANVLINPFKIPVEIDGESTTDQIVMEPLAIHNQSAAPIRVTATVSAAIKEGSNMTLVGTTTKGVTTTSKRAFIYFEIQPSDDPDQAVWDEAFDTNKHIPVRTTAKTKKNIVTLGAGDENAPAGSKCYGVFRLTGDCVVNPKSEWTETDGINATVAYTFALAPTSD